MILVDRWKTAAALLLAVGIASFYPHIALAQQVAVSEVNGNVQDHSAVTDATGRYSLVNLPSGDYRLEVTAAGFERYRQTGITLTVGGNREVNVLMTVGA